MINGKSQLSFVLPLLGSSFGAFKLSRKDTSLFAEICLSRRLECYIHSKYWSNEEKMIEYIQNIILPYVKAKQKDLKCCTTHPALVIYDEIKSQSPQLCSLCWRKIMSWSSRFLQIVQTVYSQWIWLSTRL